MKRKVLICAALLHDPDVAIFDEPESGLDVGSVLVLRHLVQVFAAKGKAILYSSHILESVEKVCENVIVLHRGRVVADASVQHLRTEMSRGSLEEVFVGQDLIRRHNGAAADLQLPRQQPFRWQQLAGTEIAL